MGKPERAGMLGEHNAQDQGETVSGPGCSACCQGLSRKSPGPLGKAVQGLGSHRAGIQLQQENEMLRRKLREPLNPGDEVDMTEVRSMMGVVQRGLLQRPWPLG